MVNVRIMPNLARRIVRYDPFLDAQQSHPTHSPSPEKFTALFRAVEQGDLGSLLELNEEMEARCSRLRSVAATRRLGVTALPWCVEAPEKFSEDKAALAAAEYCGMKLEGLPTWRGTLNHLSSAIGPNVALAELVWQNAELVHTENVPSNRLWLHPWLGPEIHILTGPSWIGIPARYPKFIVHKPETRPGLPVKNTITHAASILWLMWHYARCDWAAFAEVFGNPWRWAKVADGVPDADRTVIEQMLQNIGSDTSAVFRDGVDVNLVEAKGEGQVFDKIMTWAEKAMTILYLGQTLTTDIGDTGSRAAAEVHNDVRLDILQSDIAAESETIDQQVIRPMCELKFPGLPQEKYPHFRRKLPERRNIDAERLDLERLKYAREAGLPIDPAVEYQKLNLPEPTEPQDEEKSADAASAATINELTLGMERAARAGDLDLVNLLRQKIAALMGTELPDLTELPKVDNPTTVSVGNGDDDDLENGDDELE